MFKGNVCTEVTKTSDVFFSKNILFHNIIIRGVRKFVILGFPKNLYYFTLPAYYITDQSDNFSIRFYIYSFKFTNIFPSYISEIKF